MEWLHSSFFEGGAEAVLWFPLKVGEAVLFNVNEFSMRVDLKFWRSPAVILIVWRHPPIFFFFHTPRTNFAKIKSIEEFGI